MGGDRLGPERDPAYRDEIQGRIRGEGLTSLRVRGWPHPARGLAGSAGPHAMVGLTMFVDSEGAPRRW